MKKGRGKRKWKEKDILDVCLLCFVSVRLLSVYHSLDYIENFCQNYAQFYKAKKQCKPGIGFPCIYCT